MAASSPNLILNPLGEIQSLYAQHAEAGRHDGADFGEREFFSAALSDPSAREAVPVINMNDLNHIPNNSLVRFRGMVQDMFNPEFFITAFREQGSEWQTCKYNDLVLNGPTPSSETKMGERRPFYCVPVPAESSWYTQEATPAAKSTVCPLTTGSSRLKRGRGAEPNDVDSMATSLMSSDMEVVEAGEEAASASAATATKAMKQSCQSHDEKKHPGTCQMTQMDGGLSCLVQVYDSDIKVQLNDVIDVYGVLSHSPELAQVGFGEAEADEIAAHPATSKVPRIHAVLVCSASSGPEVTVPLVPQASVQPAREQTLRILSAVLGNDRLAAEYTLLHLLSRVVSRRDTVVVGNHSLNISGWPEGKSTGPNGLSPAGSTLWRAVQELMPRAAAVPISIEALNAKSMVPAKDYNTDRLGTGTLQLAKGTHCVLDESCIQSGQLQEQGINNMRALQSVMASQELDYDFQFYKVPMQTDLPMLIASTTRTLFRESVSTHVPLHATTAVGDMDALEAALAVSDVALVRQYLQNAIQAEFDVPEEMSSVVEAAISSYKKGNNNVDTDTFHRWLTLARLASGSKGERVLSKETWDQVMQLEHVREERLRVV